MPLIQFKSAKGDVRSIEGRHGLTLMEVAVQNGVDGIDAICGGSCACATCHVYIDPEWSERVGTPSSMELETLDTLPETRPNSRLSCQITVTASMDGLTVELPKSQVSA